MIPLLWCKRLAVILGWMNAPEVKPKPKRGPVLWCHRCEKFVKKGEPYSRKMWPDGMLRHSYNCKPEADFTQEESKMNGIWRCSGCGEMVEMGSGRWRWTGTAWEHKCEGLHPQCGHQEARYFGASLTPEDAAAVTSEVEA